MAFVSHLATDWGVGYRKEKRGDREKQSPSHTRLNKKVTATFGLYDFCYQNSLN